MMIELDWMMTKIFFCLTRDGVLMTRCYQPEDISIAFLEMIESISFSSKQEENVEARRR